MSHQETRRTVPNAKGAVLLLHGIVGSPNHFRRLIDLESQVPADYSVYNLCYPGHGGTVTDFGRSRLQQWRAYAFAAFEELAAVHDKVIIAGHSMGCLFAIQIALQHPEKVEKLYLLQVPLYLGLRFSGVMNLLRFPFGLIREHDPAGQAMLVACGVDTTPWIFRYIPWIPRMVELVREMAAVSGLVGELTVPAVAFQSRKDELVSNRSAKRLRQSGRVEVVELEKSTHFYYTPADQERMQAEFDRLFA